MSELVFYTNPQSRGRIVRRMLEECGVAYRTEVLAYGEAMKSEAYRRINPMGKVPAITFNGKPVTETAAIIAFLAEAFPEAGLIPAPAERQDYYRWMFFCAGPMEAAITNTVLGLEIPPEKQGFVGYGNKELVMSTRISAVSANPFIAGDQFSAADVYVGSHVDYGLQFKTMPEHPALRSYLERVSSRAAWQRAADLNNALLVPGD